MVFLYKNKWVLTHELTFFEDPVLFRLLWQPVRISVAFTSEIRRAEQLKRFLERFFPDDYVGGPAYGDPGSEFTDGLYLRKGITINSRGCIRSCPWCHVPTREGRIRELKSIAPGHFVQDNNLLACSKSYINKSDMLRDQKRGIPSNGGPDTWLLRPWHQWFVSQPGNLKDLNMTRRDLKKIETLVH